MTKEFTDEERDMYLKVVGRRGLSVLSLIDNLRPYIESMNDDLGKQILSDDIKMHAELLNKIYTDLISKGTAEQRDVIMLQLLDGRLKTAYDRLENYKKFTGLVRNPDPGK